MSTTRARRSWGLLAALLLAACTQQGPAPTPEPGNTLRCLPITRPTTVAGVNKLMSSYRRRPDFLGADVGASVVLGDDRSLWVFGDTLRRPTFDGPTFVRNSMMLLTRTEACVVLPPDKGAAFPDRADGVGYWPMSIGRVATRAGDDVGIGLLRVRQTGSATFDFEILGSSIARVLVPPGKAPQLISVTDVGPDRVDDSRPTWGAAVALTDDWLYIYGTANPDLAHVFGWSLHVARTRLADVRAPERWDFWSGSAWSHDPSDLGTLIPAQTGVSRVLTVFEQDGSWYAVSKRNDFVGKDLVIWKAPSPNGPFVAGPPVASIPSDQGVLQYMPLAHPDILPVPGTVLVSWSRNVADLEQIAKDPTLYRPRFKRVPLP